MIASECTPKAQEKTLLLTALQRLSETSSCIHILDTRVHTTEIPSLGSAHLVLASEYYDSLRLQPTLFRLKHILQPGGYLILTVEYACLFQEIFSSRFGLQAIDRVTLWLAKANLRLVDLICDRDEGFAIFLAQNTTADQMHHEMRQLLCAA